MTDFMPTQSKGAGAFAAFDLSRVPSPCFVIDEVRLEENLQVLAAIGAASGANILLALKAFSMWSVAPLVMDYLHGTCASGLWEARLAQTHYGKHLSTYAPAYKPQEIEEIASLSHHLIFNTLEQSTRFTLPTDVQVGLRLNPGHSEVAQTKYDPCAPHSRLGQSLGQLPPSLPPHIQGFHIHSLCEADFPPLQRTLEATLPFLQQHKAQMAWLNLGGGHLITSPDYQREDLVAQIKSLRDVLGADIYLEPGAAIAFDAGILVGEVLDVMDTDNGKAAILDVSATCHMPDVLEAPYRPALLGETKGEAVHLGGASCLAGDVIGTYQFETLPPIGSRLAFLDQAHYSMVKTSTFNGVALPAIALWNSRNDDLRIIKQFETDEFMRRLS
ncbi:MAG: carboxynorspermidine decarboxylase [Alphaproteobacteria bacterium]|nr:carboxynorspermidine decarboxylase [Alphaproteobacteria bacterium]